MSRRESGTIGRRGVLVALSAASVGCIGDLTSGNTEGTQTTTPTPTDTVTQTATTAADPDGWSVRISYDGDWQGSVTVTTGEGDKHQAFDGKGTKRVDVEREMGIEPGAVEDIVVMAQKRENEGGQLVVTIHRKGAVVARGSTDQAGGQVMVSHHVDSGGDSGTTRTATPTETPTGTPTEPSTGTGTETTTAATSTASDGYSVRFDYDGDWHGSISVTAESGDTHQAFDGQGTETVDVERELGVETDAVEDIVVSAQKRERDDDTLRVSIRKGGDVVAEASTDDPRGQVTVSHHER